MNRDYWKEYYAQYEPLFGAWHITRLIGEGSFGHVFEMEREDFGETYRAALKAITVPSNESEVKEIISEGMSEESARDYFSGFVGDLVKEFSLMSRLKGNSNVVSYENHQVIEHKDGFGWDILIQMELLTPLNDYVREHGTTRQDVIQLGIDMCRALELCQRYNIIHRDVKPENIFVSETGNYKLGDFGIARTVEKTTGGLSKKGTYNYMAPEVYRGEPYGSTVDMYSLGIVLYRLLNENRLPFLPPYPTPITHGDRESSLSQRFGGVPLPPPVHGDGRLGEIVLKACAYHSKDRYSSPGQMRAELEAILYEQSEAKYIYPEGDDVPQRSVQYVKTGEEPAAGAVSDAPKDRAGADAGDDVSRDIAGADAEPAGNDEIEKTVSAFGENPVPRGQTAAAHTGAGQTDTEAESTESRRTDTEVKATENRLTDAEELDKTVSVFDQKKSDTCQNGGQASQNQGGNNSQNRDGNNSQNQGGNRKKKRTSLIAAAAVLAAVVLIAVGIGQRDSEPSDTKWNANAETIYENGKLSYVKWSGNVERIYDEDGNLVKNRSHDEDGLVFYEVEYDENGNDWKTSYYQDGTLNYYRLREFDADGNITEESTYNADDTLSHRKTIEYDTSGKMIGYSVYNYVDNVLTSVAEYNENEQQIKYSHYDEDGGLRGYSTYEYDEAGHNVQMNAFDADGTLTNYEAYEYDANGNRIRTDCYNADGTLAHYRISEYDANGKYVDSQTYYPDGESAGEGIFTGGIGEVTAEANVRVGKEPGTGCIILGTLDAGQKVAIKGQERDAEGQIWYVVDMEYHHWEQYENMIASGEIDEDAQVYIHSDLVSLLDF